MKNNALFNTKYLDKSKQLVNVIGDIDQDSIVNVSVFNMISNIVNDFYNINLLNNDTGIYLVKTSIRPLLQKIANLKYLLTYTLDGQVNLAYNIDFYNVWHLQNNAYGLLCKLNRDDFNVLWGPLSYEFYESFDEDIIRPHRDSYYTSSSTHKGQWYKGLGSTAKNEVEFMADVFSDVLIDTDFEIFGFIYKYYSTYVHGGIVIYDQMNVYNKIDYSVFQLLICALFTLFNLIYTMLVPYDNEFKKILNNMTQLMNDGIDYYKGQSNRAK